MTFQDFKQPEEMQLREEVAFIRELTKDTGIYFDKLKRFNVLTQLIYDRQAILNFLAQEYTKRQRRIEILNPKESGSEET